MYAAQVASLVAMDSKGFTNLCYDIIKIPGFNSIIGRKSVAVHRIAAPNDRHSFMFDFANKIGQAIIYLVFAKSSDEHNLAVFIGRIQPVDQFQCVVHIVIGTNLNANGIANTAQIFNVSSVQIARTVAQPYHMSTKVEPSVTARNLPGLCRIIVEVQAFMRCIKVNLLHRVESIGSNSFHKGDGLLDGVNHRLVLFVILVLDRKSTRLNSSHVSISYA